MSSTSRLRHRRHWPPGQQGACDSRTPGLATLSQRHSPYPLLPLCRTPDYRFPAL